MHDYDTELAKSNKRKTISKKLRFQVFARDNFTCQYCGNTAIDSELHADHIIPVSYGGETVISNLITSCIACNFGKSNKVFVVPSNTDNPLGLYNSTLEYEQDIRKQVLEEQRNDIFYTWLSDNEKSGDVFDVYVETAFDLYLEEGDRRREEHESYSEALLKQILKNWETIKIQDAETKEYVHKLSEYIKYKYVEKDPDKSEKLNLEIQDYYNSHLDMSTIISKTSTTSY